MLGLTIRGRRVGAGLTLRRCAELMGLTMTNLSAVEQGQRPFTERERLAFDAAMRIGLGMTAPACGWGEVGQVHQQQENPSEEDE